jgi:hypothetical protein
MNFTDDVHSFRTGFLMGTLAKAGISAIPVIDAQGNYTSEILIRLSEEEGMPPVDIRIKVLP